MVSGPRGDFQKIFVFREGMRWAAAGCARAAAAAAAALLVLY
jgi:hypothetical protein